MHADGWRDGRCLVHVDETFGETGETAAHGVAERREQCSPDSLSARHGCSATKDSKSDSDFWDPPTRPGTVRGKEGEKITEKRFLGSFSARSGSLDVLGFPHSVRQDLS